MTACHVAVRYGDRRLFSRLVVLLRGGDSAHCEIAIPLGGGLYRCISSSFVDGGVRIKDMALPASKWRMYRTDVSEPEALAWLGRNVGRGYGWWRLVRFVLPFLRPSFGGPVCTGACAEMLGLPDADSWDLRAFEAAVSWRYGPAVQQ